MVVLTEQQPPSRMLRIIIGQPEARGILSAWHGAVPGRPSTWDLFVSTVGLLNASVERVVITAVEEERHYFAMLELRHGGQLLTLSCRPSDALALAVRSYGAEILAEESVLDAAGVLADGTRPPAPVREAHPDRAGGIPAGTDERRPAANPAVLERDPAEPGPAAQPEQAAQPGPAAEAGHGAEAGQQEGP